MDRSVAPKARHCHTAGPITYRACTALLKIAGPEKNDGPKVESIHCDDNSVFVLVRPSGESLRHYGLYPCLSDRQVNTKTVSPLNRRYDTHEELKAPAYICC